MIKETYYKLAEIFQPILKLNNGDKIIHFGIGLLCGLFYFVGVPALGIVLISLFIAYSIEIAENLVLVTPINHWDILATVAGGIVISGILFYFGIIPFNY